jgi:hypothetical protein
MQTATTAYKFLASLPLLLDFCSDLSQAFMVVQDSSVGIATRYRLDSQGIASHCRGDIVSSRPDLAWGPPSFQFNGYRVSFPVVKQLGLDVDHPPQSSAEVKERLELYLYSSSGLSWPVTVLPL